MDTVKPTAYYDRVDDYLLTSVPIFRGELSNIRIVWFGGVEFLFQRYFWSDERYALEWQPSREDLYAQVCVCCFSGRYGIN